ncbi:MAG: Ig-like domain repeat protein [Coriobacteriales bacterium]|nr:Ig-like domain repeat protein [Coriobacteriales bacterium]
MFAGQVFGEEPPPEQSGEPGTSQTVLPAYFIGPSFNSGNASADGMKTMRITGNDSLVVEPTQDASGYIRLISKTPGASSPWKYGSAFLSRRIYSETGFSAMFDIWMGENGDVAGRSRTADGWSFIIAADTNGITGGSGSLGYGGTAFTRSVAFKVDTYDNDGGQRVPFAGYGEKGGAFSQIAKNNDGDGISTRYLGAVDEAYKSPNFVANSSGYIKNVHCYSWVDYNSKERYLNLYISSTPVKPQTPTLSRTNVDIESIIGNEYYIGFTAASGQAAQEYDLKQFYVLNNYAPAGLEFTEDGKTLKEDDNTTIIEDFTAPTVPVVTQKNTNFTVGYSTDDTAVAKYQYRASLDNGSTWVDGTVNDGWKNYVFTEEGPGAGEFDLTAQTLLPFVPDGVPDTNTLVQARAIDTGGNISGASSYSWAAQPRPVASLTNPKDAQTNVYPSAAQSLILNFSQGIDTTLPGTVAIEKTAGGGAGEPSLTGGAIVTDDSRWNAAGNALTLPVSGIEYGASYEVTVDGFVSTDAVAMEAAQSFTFSTIARAITPLVGVDFAADSLTLPGAGTYLVNGTARTVSDKLIPLATSGEGGYDLHGTTVYVVTAGNGTTLADSARTEVVVPARPAAPDGLSGYDNRIYGVTSAMEFAAEGTTSYTDCTVLTDVENGDYQAVVAGTYHVRYKAINTVGGSFASEASTVIVDTDAVSLNLTAPVFGNGSSGRLQQGSSVSPLPLRIAASGNIPATFTNAEISISNTAAFELAKPPGTAATETTLEAGEDNLSFTVRPKDGLAVGDYTAVVSVTYHPEGKDFTHTAQATVHLTVVERTPVPVVDYVAEQITGLAHSAVYLVDGNQVNTNNTGVLNIDAAWFGRGATDDGPEPLSLIKHNTNSALQSDAATLVIKARPAAPASTTRALSFVGFADGAILGVSAATMDFSNNGGGSWVADIASLPGYDSEAGAITGLAAGNNYRLRYKAEAGAQGRFASVTQNLTIAPGTVAPTWGLGLDTASAATFSFDSKKWGYTSAAAAGLAHTVVVSNTGNQPTGTLSVTLSGNGAAAFALSAASLENIAPAGSNTDISVRPVAGLDAGVYEAMLTVAGSQSGQGGHTDPFSASYTLSFTVGTANIMGFAQIAPWTVGTASELAADRDEEAEIADILLNGTLADPAFGGSKAVTANLDTGTTISLPIIAWVNLGTSFNPNVNGIYTFRGTLGSLDRNVSNTSNLVPQVTVIVNDLPYGILPNVGGTLSFADAEYGYGVGAGGVAPQPVTVTNIGSNRTGELTASLAGPGAGSFVLASGGASGVSVQIASVAEQNAVSAPFTVQPVAGLTSGSYTAQVQVSSAEHGLSESFAVAFTVTDNKARGFVPVVVPGGHAGSPAPGFAPADVAATLLAQYPTVTANCTNGTVAWPVSAWNLAGSYNPSAAGSYAFTATLETAPVNHVLDAQAAVPTLTVIIDPTVNAAVPNITQHPAGGDAYTAMADPEGGIRLRVAAVASDAASGGILSYQWYRATAPTGTVGSTLMNGATSAVYEVPRASVGTFYYYCVVTNTNPSVNGTQSATRNSNTAVVRVNKRVQTAPVVIEDPGAKAAADEPFTLVASGGSGTGALVFERTMGKDAVATVSPDGTVTVYGAGQIAVVAHRLDDTDWETGIASASLTITIAKAAPDVVAPTGLSATYGDLLSSVSLISFTNSGSETSPVPGLWSWDNPLAIVGNVGTRTPLATFTPTDTGNNETVRGVAVPLTVTARSLTVDMSGLSFASKHYDGLTTVSMTGAPALVGVVGTDNVGLNASGVSYVFASESVGENTVERTGSYALTGGAATNYTLTQPSDSIANLATISSGFTPEAGVHYTATPLNQGWTNEDVVITAAAGYKVSAENLHASSWLDSLTLDTAAVQEASKTFYLRRAATGTGDIAQNEISTLATLDYGIERTAPEVKVRYNENALTAFLNSISFGLFFKETVDIELAATDAVAPSSGVETLRYYLDRNPGSTALTAAALEGRWQTYSELARPAVAEHARFALYVEAIDYAGNSSGILTDGVIVYSDSTINTQDLSLTRFADADATAYVVLNGNTIKAVERTGYSASGGAPESVLADEGQDEGAPVLGASYSVNGNRILLDGDYLKTLQVGTHSFTVSYNPLGVAYSSADARNDTPETTSFTIVVSKAQQNAVQVTGSGVAASSTAPGSVTRTRESGSLALTASGGSGSGAYTWTSSETDVATVAPTTGNETTASFVGYKTDGTTLISAVKAGDDDYVASAPVELTLTVSRDGTAPVVGGSVEPAVSTITASEPIETGAETPSWNTTLSWTAASDTFTEDSALTYYVYQHATAIDDMEGVESAMEHGTLLNEDDTVGITTYNVTGLEPDTSYWFNIVVEDEAGNKAAYTAVRVLAPLTVEVTSAVQQNGVDGTEATDGILVTFDREVAGFYLDNDAYALHDGVTRTDTAYPYPKNPEGSARTSADTWFIPVSALPIANGTTLEDALTIKSWKLTVREGTGDQAQDRTIHDYRIKDDSVGMAVTFYKPVPEDTPEAWIDYVNRTVAGLAEGKTYIFGNNTEGIGHVERFIGTDLTDPNNPSYKDLNDVWHYPINDTWLGAGIDEVSDGVTTEGIDVILKGGTNTVNSAATVLFIPRRPAQPELTVHNPGNASDPSIVTVTNATADTAYEYRVGITGEAGYGEWQNVEDANKTDTSVILTGLQGGRYTLRVKAVAAPDDETQGSFSSPATAFYVHDFGEVRFDAQLQGYTLPSTGDTTDPLTAQTVHVAAGATVDKVEWTGESAEDAEDWFKLQGSGNVWTIQPVAGLEPGIHQAKIKIMYSAVATDEEQNVTFTVHPKIEFADTEGVAVSDTDEDGVSDTMTLTFKYPIVGGLSWNEVVVNTAVVKDPSAHDFKNAQAIAEGTHNNVYVIPIAPASSAVKTEASASVEVRMDLNGKLDTYQKQNSEQGRNYIAATTPITVPRAIAEAEVFAALPGYSTSTLQFTLAKPAGEGADKNYYPIIATYGNPDSIYFYPTDENDNLDISYPYDGPVRITDSDGDPIEGLKITMILPIDEGSYFAGTVKYTWTWRVFFSLGDEFTDDVTDVMVSIPSLPGTPGFGVAAVEASGTITKAVGLLDSRYILNGGGVNYLTDMHAFQKLHPVDAGGAYTAPALDFPTSADLGSGSPEVSIRDVYLDIPGDDRGFVALGEGAYTVKSGGGVIFNFTDADPTFLDDQLIFSLKADWTRINGTYRLAIVLSDLAVAQATFDVTGITPTYRLILTTDDSGSAVPVATSDYGTPDGCYEAAKPVTLTAGNSAEGYRFGYWTQNGDDAVTVELEDETASTTTFTMPPAPVILTANYLDGVAPVTTADLANEGWMRDKVTLTATDNDVTKATGGNLLGEGLGTVREIHYRVDAAAVDTIVAGATAEVLLTALPDGRHTISYWAEDEAENAEAAHTLTVYKDATPPTGSITARGIAYAGLPLSDSLAKFWAGDVSLALSGADGAGSGMQATEYLVRTTPFGSEADAKAATGWTAGSAPNITIDGSYFVYARLTDNTGNVRVVGTEGFVRYTQSATTTTTTFTKASGTDAVAAVAMHGNTVADIVRTAGGSEFALESTDYSAGSPADTITLTAAYLQTLDAGTHSFTVSYNPLGKPYAASQSTDDPRPTTLTVAIARNTSSVTLACNPLTSSSYAENNVTLTATVAGEMGFMPRGKVEFWDDHDNDALTPELSLGTETVDGSGEASLTLTLSGGDHRLRAAYEGDTDYESSESSSVSYNITRAAQAAVFISGPATVSATYGDQAFELTATGGSGSEPGTYAWRSQDPDVATIGELSGRINIIGQGSTTIYAKRLGDANYNDSAEAWITLVVAPKPLTVTMAGLAFASKHYDGRTDLAVMGEAALAGVVNPDLDGIALDSSDVDFAFASAEVGTSSVARTGSYALAAGSSRDVRANYTLAQPATTLSDVATILPGFTALAEEHYTATTLNNGWTNTDVVVTAATGFAVSAGNLDTSTWQNTLILGSAPVDANVVPFYVRRTGTDLEADEDNDAITQHEISTVASFTFSIDKTAPVVQVGYNANTASDFLGSTSPALFFRDGVEIELEVTDTGSDGTAVSSDIETLRFYLDAAPGNTALDATALASLWQDYDAAEPLSVEAGTAFALYVEARDYAGNSSGILRDGVVVYEDSAADTELVNSTRFGSTDAEVFLTLNGNTVADLERTGYDAVWDGISPPGSVSAGEGLDADAPALAMSYTVVGDRISLDGNYLAALKTGTHSFTVHYNPLGLTYPLSGDTRSEAPASSIFTVVVAPATPVLVTEGSLPILAYGDGSLASLGLETSGYVFGGSALKGEATLSGTLSWDAPNASALVPGAVGFETDVLGNDARNGLFVAAATFTPDPALYANSYDALPLMISVRVGAAQTSLTALDSALSSAEQEAFPSVTLARENYDEQAVDALDATMAKVHAAFEAAAKAGGQPLTQAEVEALLAELDARTAALDHSHPVLSSTVGAPITAYGQSVEVSFKGDFGSVSSVSLNGRIFALGAVSSTPSGRASRQLLLDGTEVGTLTQGSAVVGLDTAFVDTLANGSHLIELRFVDDFKAGTGSTAFMVDRPAQAVPAPAPAADGGSSPASLSYTPLEGSQNTQGDTTDSATRETRPVTRTDTRPGAEAEASETAETTELTATSETAPYLLSVTFGVAVLAIASVLAVLAYRIRSRKRDADAQGPDPEV